MVIGGNGRFVPTAWKVLRGIEETRFLLRQSQSLPLPLVGADRQWDFSGRQLCTGEMRTGRP